uniref:Putative serine/threonine-protein kinase DDB_G0267514 n=1 Tax=Anthurium amnicola TaxID=1678845 RepID=A0A1D1XKZ4_9ARAE
MRPRGQEIKQRALASLLSSPAQAPPVANDTRQPNVCFRVLSSIYCVLASENQQRTKQRFRQQLSELEREIQQQRSLNAIYKDQLKRMENYLRYCLDIATENGFLELIINNQQASPPTDVDPSASIWQNPMTTSNSMPGELAHKAKLNGWYIEPHEIELQEKIGQGTTADIYKGTWRGLDVAVKWIYPDYFCSNEGAETYFAQELETLSRQRHPFVLRLMGACLFPPENGWVVTELLSGRTLAEWLHGHKKRRRDRLTPLPPLEERIEKGLEIAQAMQYLHEQKPKVIHRDLKPSNIFLDDAMHIRVADFGHARFLADGEQALTGETGTYVYMAPEVIRSEPYNEKCDVYSFSIILNELITGEHPYIETDYGPSKVALEVGEGRLRPLLPRCHHWNRDLIDLICCSWDGDASARPSFASITSSLRKILEHVKINVEA